MTITKDKMTEVARDSAAEMAEKLGMHLVEDITSVKVGQPLMIVTAKGIQMGTLTTRDMANMRYVSYKLNDQKLFEKRHGFSGKDGWNAHPTTNVFLHKEALIFVGE